MIKPSDLLHIPFYDKTHFTGSCQGMRFYIEKDTSSPEAALKAWVFPGPYCFEKTPEEEKSFQTFPFSEEGLAQTADWLNQQYEARPDYWNAHNSTGALLQQL